MCSGATVANDARQKSPTTLRGPARVLARPVELVPDDPPVAKAIEVPQVEVRLELARPPARVPDQVDERGAADHLALEHLDPVVLPRLGQHLVLAANRLPVG